MLRLAQSRQMARCAVACQRGVEASLRPLLAPEGSSRVCSAAILAMSARSLHSSAYLRKLAEEYKAASIEPKWRKRWVEAKQEQRSTQSSAGKGKHFYSLSMFPYPSGSLHMGHVRVYTISDCMARLHRMQGYQVLHPMGWDAFGLPAENAAIDRGIHPAKWTYDNIKHMRSQLDSLGISFDWDREVTTCDPSYYKWTQWLFVQLLKKGLVYQKDAFVNWDPVDKTVLANEQVDANGRSWRSGALVERRKLKQWFIKITDYAEELLQSLDKLSGWPQQVAQMQRNWIGRTDGALVRFKLDIGSGKATAGANSTDASADEISVFTSRPDTIFGVSFLVLAPEHPVINNAIQRGLISAEHKAKLTAFRDALLSKTDVQRQAEGVQHGVDTGLRAINPVNGQRVPVLVASYVLPDVGTGSL